MRRGKNAKRTGYKIFLVMLTLALVCTATIAGTLAWLTDRTEEVVNTFSTSGIEITLTEEGTTENNGKWEKSFQMIPGFTIEKDPIVSVTDTSEDCWLFVKVVKSANYDRYMTYDIDTDEDEWTELFPDSGIYYRKVMSTDTTRDFGILKDNKVTVRDDVGVAEMTAAKTNVPSLSFTAYAIQYYKTNGTAMPVEDAWAAISA